ncbi:uncharacterized protein LOC21401523 [Morus notabilis]|uniref:uncharacterized protein LOC21401523 n=1 Tax=Morus notabilis TaxID=981085 RepID=UPI000CED3D21|nr:uncharacterized protein LOC21401523 [Morus notabilis]
MYRKASLSRCPAIQAKKKKKTKKKKMVNIFVCLVNPLLHAAMNLLGLKRQKLEIEQGTIMNFWVSAKTLDKPVLVLLHGFAANGVVTWMFQIPALTREFSVFVPDFLFFGDSFSESGKRSPEFQAECLAKGLKLLGVERCVVVAFSYGGFVGFKLAELWPELVRHLVVSGSVVGLTQSLSNERLPRIGFKSWSELLVPKTVEDLKRLFFVVTQKKLWFPSWAFRHYLEVMFNNRREKVELLEALVINDEDYFIPNFSLQSIHFLVGEDDKIFNLKMVQDVVLQLEDKATLHGIKEAGHLVHIERPFVYNNSLKKILLSLKHGHHDIGDSYLC